MKKILILFLILIVLLSGCKSSKTPISAQDFKTTMEEHQFVTGDATQQYNGQVEEVIIANNGHYQLEFFVMPSEDSARISFNTNKSNFETKKVGQSSQKSASLGNYDYYYMSSNDIYYIVSRIDNTFLYGTVSKEYKGEVQSLLKELGY